MVTGVRWAEEFAEGIRGEGGHLRPQRSSLFTPSSYWWEHRGVQKAPGKLLQLSRTVPDPPVWVWFLFVVRIFVFICFVTVPWFAFQIGCLNSYSFFFKSLKVSEVASHTWALWRIPSRPCYTAVRSRNLALLKYKVELFPLSLNFSLNKICKYSLRKD